MKKYIINITIIMLFFCLFVSFSGVYASEWWKEAYNFFDDVDWENHRDDAILDTLLDLLKVAGNAVFIIVAIVLGIKYMLGSAEGKADIKDGLVSLTIAMVLFYGYSALEDVFTGGGSKLVFVSNSDTTTVANIYSTIIYFLNAIAIGAVAYVGIKYLLSGAEGKADLKGKGIPFIVGMILTFSTLEVLKFIRDIINDVL